MPIENLPAILAGVSSGAVAGKIIVDQLNKMLGPTSEYLGRQLLALFKKRESGKLSAQDRNLLVVLHIAWSRALPNLDEPGLVPPRVLKRVWEEGRWVDQLIAQAYFGGLLASARTTSALNDNNLHLLHLVSSMSNLELVLHYAVYYGLYWRYQPDGRLYNLGATETRRSIRIIVGNFASASGEAAGSFDNPAVDIPLALANRGLLEHVEISGGVIHQSPSLLGLKLFMLVHGNNKITSPGHFFEDNYVDRTPIVDLDALNISVTPKDLSHVPTVGDWDEWLRMKNTATITLEQFIAQRRAAEKRQTSAS